MGRGIELLFARTPSSSSEVFCLAQCISFQIAGRIHQEQGKAMAFIRLSGTRRAPPSNRRMMPAGAEHFLCPHPGSRSQISSPSPPKKLYEILVWLLYPGEDLNPIFKCVELAAWDTATSFSSKHFASRCFPAQDQRAGQNGRNLTEMALPGPSFKTPLFKAFWRGETRITSLRKRKRL